MYESIFVDDGDLLFTEPRSLNDEKLRARLDPQMEPDKRLRSLGCMGDFPQADVVVEQGQMNRERTTAGNGDSTTRSC